MICEISSQKIGKNEKTNRRKIRLKQKIRKKSFPEFLSENPFSSFLKHTTISILSIFFIYRSMAKCKELIM
jgi:hypothetical protein